MNNLIKRIVLSPNRIGFQSKIGFLGTVFQHFLTNQGYHRAARLSNLFQRADWNIFDQTSPESAVFFGRIHAFLRGRARDGEKRALFLMISKKQNGMLLCLKNLIKTALRYLQNY